VTELWVDPRARVVAIALEWERTPYVHQGRIKGKCADCTFPAKVYEEAGLMPAIEIPQYGPQAHLNRQAAPYIFIVERHAKREITEKDALPGDLVMFRIARTWSHSAIIIDSGWPHVIHADIAARFVIRARGDQGELRVERRFFSFW
jgi:cell wall-associated NlpC family hydrolase